MFPNDEVSLPWPMLTRKRRIYFPVRELINGGGIGGCYGIRTALVLQEFRRCQNLERAAGKIPKLTGGDSNLSLLGHLLTRHSLPRAWEIPSINTRMWKVTTSVQAQRPTHVQHVISITINYWKFSCNDDGQWPGVIILKLPIFPYNIREVTINELIQMVYFPPVVRANIK